MTENAAPSQADVPAVRAAKPEVDLRATSRARSHGTRQDPMRAIVLIVGVAIAIFLVFSAYSVKQAIEGSAQLSAIKDLYFPVLERVDANIVRLDKMEALYTQAVMTGERDDIGAADEIAHQADDAFREMAALYAERAGDVASLREGFAAYHDLASVTSRGLLGKTFSDIPGQAERMNAALEALRRSIRAFRQSSYDNFASSLLGSQRAALQSRYLGIALGIMNLGFMAVLVFFMRHNVRMMAVVAQQNATLEERVTERTAQLNRKTNDIERLYRDSEQQRIELAKFHDAAQAESEQASFLLSRLSQIEQLEQPGVRYFWEPAEVFSGDVIAVARSMTGDVYGLLADATGHGLAAAINLIPLTGAFYAMVAKGFSLLTIAEQLNTVVKNYSLPDRFVAATLVRFARRERQLEVVNAGNPTALLLNCERQVVREFDSGCIPLGIVDRKLFKPRVEAVELQGDEDLLLFSDGLVEASDAEGRQFGRLGLDRALAQTSPRADLIPPIRTALAQHTGDVARADDISVLLLSSAEVAAAASPEKSPVPLPDAMPSQGLGRQDPWKVTLQLSCAELKRVEGVPMILDLTRALGLGRAVEARFFTILSELFQNALEHGLLGLDSRVKADPGGFERYLDLRAERLGTLLRGTIEINLTHWRVDPSGGRLHLVVTDSGPGFDHREHLRRLAHAAVDPSASVFSGRGIALLQQLCNRVEFNADGNQASVEFSYA